VKHTLSIIVLALTIAFVGSGCSHRIGEFTIVSTKNYETKAQYKLVGRIEGSDKKMIILFFPLGTPTINNAVDDAIQNGGGVYLANAVIESSAWYFILLGQTGFTVTGDVYAAVDRGDLLNPNIEKFELKKTGDALTMVSTSNGNKIAVQDITDAVAN